MGIIKYTLLCKNGYLQRTDTHYLILGEWLSFAYGYTILQHGILSEEEARQIEGQTLVNVYQDIRNKCIGIHPGYHEKYLNRTANKADLTLYAGCLQRESTFIWRGKVNIK